MSAETKTFTTTIQHPRATSPPCDGADDVDQLLDPLAVRPVRQDADPQVGPAADRRRRQPDPPRAVDVGEHVRGVLLAAFARPERDKGEVRLPRHLELR